MCSEFLLGGIAVKLRQKFTLKYFQLQENELANLPTSQLEGEVHVSRWPAQCDYSRNLIDVSCLICWLNQTGCLNKLQNENLSSSHMKSFHEPQQLLGISKSIPEFNPK